VLPPAVCGDEIISAGEACDDGDATSGDGCSSACQQELNWNCIGSPSVCTVNTQSANCSPVPVANAHYNISSTFTQTWNGSTAWVPASMTTVYSATAGTCKFTCNSGYHWSGSACVSNTANGNCSPLVVANSEYNISSTFPQTWDGSAYVPASMTTTYSATAGTCKFKCKSGFTWNGSVCNPTPINTPCAPVPPNAQFNTLSYIIQTWSGSSWQPPLPATVYSATPGNCKFVCLSGFTWNGSACVPFCIFDSSGTIGTCVLP
jgi:cysteine-rich repeat protein